MFHGIFSIRYITSKNCFCHLSEQNSKYLENGVTLKLSYSTNKISYLSPQPLPSLKENEIGINRLQAQALGLLENHNVMVSVCHNIPGIRSLTVSPTMQEDYEILEMLAENIESTLLNQIRIVNENQKFVIWVTDSIHVIINVDVVDPVTPGRLNNLTEICIVPPKFDIVEDGIENSESTDGWGFHKLLGYFSKSACDANALPQDIVHKFSNSHRPLGFILHSVNDLLNHVKNRKLQYFNVFVHQDCVPKNFCMVDSSSNIFSLKIISPPVINNSCVEENNTNVKIIVVRLCILENNLTCKRHKIKSIPPLYVHQCILKHFDIQVGSKAYLDNCMKLYPSVNGIEINTIKECSKSAIENFKSCISQNCQDEKMLMNSNVILRNSEFIFSLKFSPPTAKFCLIDSDFVRNCKFTVADSDLFVEQPDIVKNISTYFSEDFGNVKQLIEESISLLKMGLVNIALKPENVLIIGKRGSGKSTLIKNLSTKLFNVPLCNYSETISCKNIKGKSIESLHRVFSNKIINLVYYQPSVLIFDDLHIICEKVTEGDALSQETLHFNRVSEMIAVMLENILSRNKIAVLATSESAMKLNQHIFSSRGLHLFKNVLNINELDKNDRFSLLNFLFNQKCKLKNVDLEQLSRKTEGFVVQDLVKFADKSIFESLKEEKLEVTVGHCEVSLQNTTALSLKDVQLHSPGDRVFSDIGGLDDVKKVLVECMMWPVQYPNLFGNAPLRLQSGLLLYGPPGTGKTMLASAAAKHCGLKLISIKGPQLLSKYIGASEQAVRNVFEKAQTAKPCILFFDEFDSLAPRRGHDSTGVTDRVVNQLLTQLDGIESLNGVCVLAATSRPDLLDPALLRPGRIDQQILCSLPNTECRLKILKALSKKMVFASSVDLQKIAKNTIGYSGADLQAILYTAQLSAVENLLDQSKGKADDIVEINQEHLEEALKNTRPSLTQEENLKFKIIYSKFQRGSDLVDVKSVSQRATLA